MSGLVEDVLLLALLFYVVVVFVALPAAFIVGLGRLLGVW